MAQVRRAEAGSEEELQMTFEDEPKSLQTVVRPRRSSAASSLPPIRPASGAVRAHLR